MREEIVEQLHMRPQTLRKRSRIKERRFKPQMNVCSAEDNIMMLRAERDQLRTCKIEVDSDGAISQRTLRDIGPYNAKFIENWQLTYERIRFADDKINIRPLAIQQNTLNENEKIVKVCLWLTMFDFEQCQIVGQRVLQLPDLEVLYEPEVSISASTNLYKKAYDIIGFEYQQNFQVAICLKHQRRVKMMDFRIKWNEILGRDDKGVEICHVATRELILAKQYMGLLNESFDFILLPMFD